MSSSPKLYTFAHVTMTLLITVASTTTTISTLNITDTTLATAAFASIDTRTMRKEVAKAASAIESDIQTVKLVNSTTTGTNFSISSKSTRAAPFYSQTTPVTAAAAAAAAAAAYKTTPSSKNTPITVSPIRASFTNSTKNKTLSPVLEMTPQKTVKLPPQEIRNPIVMKYIIHSDSTMNLSTITNSINIINKPRQDNIASKTSDPEANVYSNINNGGKPEGTESVHAQPTRNSFTPTDTVTSRNTQETTTGSSELDKVKKSTKNTQYNTNNSGYRWPPSSLLSSASLSRQTVPLHRKRFAHPHKIFPRAGNFPDNKYDTVNADGYIHEEAMIREIQTEKSSFANEEILTDSVTPSNKPLKQLKSPLKKLYFQAETFHLKKVHYSDKVSPEVNTRKTERFNFLPDQEKSKAESSFKTGYKLKLNDRKSNLDIFHVTSQQSNFNKKGIISRIKSVHSDLLHSENCRHCTQMKKQKKRVLQNNSHYKNRKRRSLKIMRIPPTKTEVIHFGNTNQEIIFSDPNSQTKPFLAEILEQPNNYGRLRGTSTLNAKEMSYNFSPKYFQKEKKFSKEEKEKDSVYEQFVSSKPQNDEINSLVNAENISVVNGVKTESEIGSNSTNTTRGNLSFLHERNLENYNRSKNIKKHSKFPTQVTGSKNFKCKDKLCFAQKRKLLWTNVYPNLRKPLAIMTQTLIKFPKESNNENYTNISKRDKLKIDPNNSGFNFKEYIQEKRTGIGKINPRKNKNNAPEVDFRILQNDLWVSVEDKERSGDLLKSLTNGSNAQFVVEENVREPSRFEKNASFLSKDSKIKNGDNFLARNPGQSSLKDSDELLKLTKRSSFASRETAIEKSRLTKNMHTSDKKDNSDLINNNEGELSSKSGISFHHRMLNQDYTHSRFMDNINGKADHQSNISERKSTSRFVEHYDFKTVISNKTYSLPLNITEMKANPESDNSQKRVSVNKPVILTKDDETVTNEIDKEYPYSEENDEQEMMYGYMNPGRDFFQRQSMRNAHESISYQQSHDFFLDPEYEKRRLERKVHGRWSGQLLHHQRHNSAASTLPRDIHLPIENINNRYDNSNNKAAHDFKFRSVERGQYLSRTRRSIDSLYTDTSTAQKSEDFRYNFPSDDDEGKPCGNHGRHRSHTGGLHHLTQHQRRVVHREPRARHRYPRDVRFPSDFQTSSGDGFGKAAYFSGVRELLQLRVRKRSGLAQEMIPRQHFTIELWIKPEGGQSNPTVVLGLFDMCHQDHKAKGWHIGIRTYEDGQEEDARIYFSLETDRANLPSVIMSDRTYEPNRWVHVAASYTGKKMKLYINTALVGVQNLHTGDIFSVSASRCKEIFLGGKPYSKEDLYRGSIDQILIWNFPLKHRDVVQNMFDYDINTDREKGIVFKESFDDLSQWKFFLKREPELHLSNIDDYRYDLKLVAPPCGKTVCDDPDVIRSYVRHSELRQEKKVRYRIVNVMNDDEDNPKVSEFQTVAQHRALVSAFKQYNISWELEEVKLRNTSLRHKTVLLDCLPIQIGNKHCNRECQHTQTGNDGGDCDPDEIPCDAINLGNGRCDFECNRAYYEWDKGDCCQSAFKSANSTCLDPDSPHRIYLSMNEYKTALNVNGSTHLNVYLASWSLKGLATFPWEKHVYDVLGGTVVDTNSFGQPGKMDSLIHEFGHNLGLWHVHHGVSEIKCDDPCVESEASLNLGDLCSDTAPTAQNTHCRDPDWTVQACGFSSFKNTPYRNYMSYASGNCTNHFTPQQVARMHCYLDLVYQPWQTTMKPSPVPLPPKVVAATLDSVTVVWLPGLGDNVYGPHSECHRCTQDGALIQYASSARAPADSKKKLHWNKEEALGPPDAERCKASGLSWMQESFECKSKCYIEFMFKYSTVPQSISIWVVWKAAFGIKNVKFYFMDGSTDSLGPIRAFCDVPFTAKLNYTKKVKKVRIYPNNTYVGIDGIQLISTPESAGICSSCRPTKYQVKRFPDFPRPVYTSDTLYTDGSVIRGVNYSYTIQVNIGNKVSGPSPALRYQHGQPFCGNGRVEINLGEDCDDGNINDGDGCTSDCEIENFYRCKGTPSLCYRHDGDGICEEDEQNISLRDCGYYTPEGYDDQWPVLAVGNPHLQLSPECSEEALVGTPTRFQVCKNNVGLPGTWRRCNTNYFDTPDHWIKVYYARPVIAVGVVIYLGSDGRTYDSPEPKSLLVQLIDTEDIVTYVEHKLVVSCQSNPIYVPILHDLSRPFFRTKGVKLLLSSSNIAIAGIRLRTSQHFDPITPESCSQEQFYNPRSQQCVNQTCPRKFCEQLIIENANTKCTGRGEGDTCQVTCLDGYRIRNELEVICADGVWRRSHEVSCVPVDCRWPAMVHATFICPQGTTFKQSCSFRCNPPAQLQGSGSMVTCEADGRWSMVNAYCLAFCYSPIEYPNAYSTSPSCQIERAHQAGSRCKFRCEKGYHIEGLPAKRRSLRLTCKESGEWGGKKCVRVMCKTIPPEFTGMYTCSESTYGGSRCILKCPGESSPQKIKCLQKGVWSSHFKMCNFPKSAMCPVPLLTDPRVQLRNCDNRSAGSTCHVTCNSQAYQPALPHMNGTVLDSKDRVMKLTCTGMLKWLPNPRHISCKGICRVMSLEDGWCDSANNRFFCGWDKGDCCASTVDGGKIRLDKPTCKSKCACKDPNAKENSNKSRK